MGSSKTDLSGFPPQIRTALGYQLFKIQEGQTPTVGRRLTTVGSGVFEIKEHDSGGWYRIIYFVQRAGAVVVLHCFQKKSRKTSRADLELARSRLKKVWF